MKTIIVTGATSFLGRNLIELLLTKNYNIYAIVRKSSSKNLKLKNTNLKYIYCDLDNIEHIYEHINEADIFVHFAWDGSGSIGRNDKKIQFNNVNYSMRALEVAINLNCKKFIFPGSQAEYGKKFDLIDETTSCTPESYYGKSKLMFSQKAFVRCENEKIKFIHLRIFSVYGYGDRKGTLVDSCINKFNKGKVMELGPCTQKWNYLYISDFVNIVSLLIKSNCDDGIYNIASSETKILKEFVNIIYDLSNKTGKFEFNKIIPDNPEKSPDLNPSIHKISQYLPKDYKFTKFEDGIKLIMKKMEDEYEGISIERKG